MRITPVALFMLAIMTSVSAKEPVVRDPYWLIKLKLCEGTTAERELGKHKVLSAPSVMTIGSQPFTVQVGGAVQAPQIANDKPQFAQYGLMLQGNCKRVDGEVIQLELNCQNSALVKNTPEGIEIKGTSVHVIKRIKLGKTTVLSTNETAEKRQSWIEVTVEEVADQD